MVLYSIMSQKGFKSYYSLIIITLTPFPVTVPLLCVYVGIGKCGVDTRSHETQVRLELTM